MKFDEESFRDLLLLSTIPGVGAQRLRTLINFFKTPKSVLNAKAVDLSQVQGIDSKTIRNIINHPRDNIFCDTQISKLNKVNGKFSTLWDDDYPFLLKKIYDPPPYIFYRGELPLETQNLIALVGTRLPTQYGKSIAQKFSSELAISNIVTVSGLARGIDSIVHSSTLKTGGKTIAVIGCGLDIIYPPENKNLADEISGNGAIISEFYMGESPEAAYFPRRNRIISGLSLATIIIESSVEGGAMITAKTAFDQNREVYCTPGSIFEKTSSGTNKLIRDGIAKLVICVEDILKDLNLSGKETKSTPRPELNMFEQIIVDRLNTNPKHIDLLAEETSLSQSDLLVALLNLEFKNIVKQLPGKYFILEL